MDTLLRADGLSKVFGGLAAVNEVSFAVERGSIKAIIGPNGAGKTTLFDLLTGIQPATAGRIWFEESEITGLRPHRISALGIARTFQTIQLFANLTVLQNVMVGRHIRTRCGFARSSLRLPGCLREEREIRNRPSRTWTWSGWDCRRRSSRTPCPSVSSACWSCPGPWPPVPS